MISIDNMQIINRARHEPRLLREYEGEFELSKSIVKSKLPGAFHYIITSFFRSELRKKRTTLVPSILRPEILAATPEEGEHVLVYQTATSNQQLPEVLKKIKRPFRIYGMKRDIKSEEVDDNLTYRPFSEKSFIEDLRKAYGVIAGGGYTLMSECVYLHKPMLCVPIEGQFEQILNALYLEDLGYGRHAKIVNAEVVEKFLHDIPQCAAELKSYHQEGNDEMIRTLNQALERTTEHRGAWFDADDT